MGDSVRRSSWRRWRRPARLIGLGFSLVVVIALAAGCATYSAKISELRPQLALAQYDAALATVEKETGKKDQLLFYLERGTVLHYADRWRESNEAFAAAERTADELYTKSISEGALSLITNDNAISYRARPYEMAMVPYFQALNYIYLGEREGALVEARKASFLLAKYTDVTLAGLKEEDDRDRLEKLRNNAFLLYFNGMLYDWDGELNDAFIAYRNAAVAYQGNRGVVDVEIPATLGADLIRVGKRLGFREEVAQLRRSCPDVFSVAEGAAVAAGEDLDQAAWTAGNGELVLLLEVGYIPQKTEVRIDIPIFEGEAYDDVGYWSWQIADGLGNTRAFAQGHKVEYWLALALPDMPVAPVPIRGARLRVAGTEVQARGYRSDDLASAARVTFESEYGTILLKTIARGLTKYLATREVGKQGWAARLTANIFAAASESADTRSWLTLPEHICLMRLSLPPGSYQLQVDLIDNAGKVVDTRTIADATVTAGEWTFLSRRVF